MKTRSSPQQTADSVWKEEITLQYPSHPGHHPNPRVSLNCLNWDYNWMIDNSNVIDGRYQQARWIYRVARNFCGSLFLRIGDFSVLRKLIFGIRTHWLFSMIINFCDFQKIPSTFPASRGISRRGKNERKNERPLLAGNQYPALELFSFLLSTCNQGAIEVRYIF